MYMFKLFRDIIASVLLAFTFNSCSTIPKGAKAVTSFNKERYLGKWYEIARLDFVFEKNMNNTTATYSLNKDAQLEHCAGMLLQIEEFVKDNRLEKAFR